MRSISPEDKPAAHSFHQLYYLGEGYSNILSIVHVRIVNSLSFIDLLGFT